MKNLKNKSIILLVLMLSAALLLSACGTSADTASADAGTAAEAVSSELTGGSLDAVALSAENGSVTGTESDYFSNRDLSGEYDADEAVTITLTGATAEASSEAVQVSGGTVTITEAGTYVLSGTLDDGCIVVDATKDDKIQLVLDGVSILSSDYAAIYVKQADKVFITLAEDSVNSLANGGSFVQRDENDVDAVIFAKDDITLNGTGTLRISSPAGSGIVGKDEVTITDGVYEISADSNAIRAKDSLAIAGGSFALAAGSDGLHAENGDDDTLGNIYIAGGTFEIRANDDAIHANTLLQIDGGIFNITAAEGLEATYVLINDGTIQISASDDGINAANKSSACTPTVEINGGSVTIVMGGGDTDGVDSNGNIIINGGTVDVTGQSAFDYDGTAQFNGGTIIVNGEQVDTIPNQMMGGGFGGMDGSGGFGGMGGFGGGRRR